MGADNMIVVVQTVVNGVPGWVVAYFQGVPTVACTVTDGL